MHLKDLYAIVVTERRAEGRDFYARWFGFQVAFEASWFVYLAATGDRPFGLAFMSPDHPSEPPGSDAFAGRGLLITLQVEDAAAEFERVRAGGLAVAHPLRDGALGPAPLRRARPGGHVGRRRRADRAGPGLLGAISAMTATREEDRRSH